MVIDNLQLFISNNNIQSINHENLVVENEEKNEIFFEQNPCPLEINNKSSNK